MRSIKPFVVTLVAAFATGAWAPVEAADGLPAHLSFGAMFLNADWVVKAVVIGLGLASLATWTVFVAKSRELMAQGAAYARLRDVFNAARSLEALRRSGDAASRGDGLVYDLRQAQTRPADSREASGEAARLQAAAQTQVGTSGSQYCI